MLVLTRRTDESIVIDGRIVITILGVEGDKIKIGIEAPRDVPILRHELWLAIEEQKQIAEQLAVSQEPPGFDTLRQFLSEVVVPEPDLRPGMLVKAVDECQDFGDQPV